MNLIREGLTLLAQRPAPRNRGGRPIVLDDGDKGKLTILLATGLSLRQSAAFLGLAPSTVSDAIAADEEFRADIGDARVRAELHPLTHLIRESGRSWKTAVWMLDYLQKQGERERKEEQRHAKESRTRAARSSTEPSHSPPAPMSDGELARIAAIRAQRPRRKRRKR